MFPKVGVNPVSNVCVKSLEQVRSLERVAEEQRGVLSRADLESLLAARSPNGLAVRIGALERAGVLRRFCRGFYVTAGFDLPTLGQRIATGGYVSFGTVLADRQLIGTRPDRQVMLARVGKSREYRGLGVSVVVLQIAPHLDFGHEVRDGVRFADAEKAVLDTLYFHLRGRRYPFDVFGDIDYLRLDARRTRDYLSRYRNPKFVAFVTSLLGDHGVSLEAIA